MYYVDGKLTREHTVGMKLNPNGYLGYIRVSTTKQEEEGYGPDLQENGIRTYAASQGLPLITPCFIDDISGDNPEREALDNVKELLRQGRARGVIIYRPDRLARKVWIGMYNLEEIHGVGREVHFTNLGSIPNTPEGRFQASIHFSVGELDKAHILQKLKQGRAAHIASNRPYNNGWAKYGYRFEGRKKDAHWIVVEEEAEVIRLIFRLHHELRSTTEVARELTRRQVPTFEDIHNRESKPGKKVIKKRAYGSWAPAQVHEYLTYPGYMGKHPHNRQQQVIRDGKRRTVSKELSDPSIVWVDVPAIISRRDWDLSQKIIRENDSRGGNKEGKREYLLSRRAKCGYCESAISGKRIVSKNKDGSKQYPLYYYICQSSDKKHLSLRDCHMPTFKREEVERVVWEYVEYHLLDPDALEVGIRDMMSNRSAQRAKLEERAADLRQRLTQLDSQKQRLVAAVQAGIFSLEDIAAQKHQLDANAVSYQEGLDATEEELEQLGTTDEEIMSLREYATFVRDRLDISNFEHRREILRLMGVQVYLCLEQEVEPDTWVELTPEQFRAEGGVKTIHVISYINPDPQRLQLFSPIAEYPSTLTTARHRS